MRDHPQAEESPVPCPVWCGWSTDIGNKATQQDRACLLLDLLPGPVHGFAVFDGHGEEGHKAAAFAAKHVRRVLLQALGALLGDPPRRSLDELDAPTLTQALTTTFHHLHEEMLAEDSVDTYMSGTTAVLLLLTPRHIVCAGVGDSGACLVKRDGRELALTVEHNCADATERGRIEARGGRVEKVDDAPDSPFRVFKGSLPYPGIVVSRTLGDAVAAKLGVIQDPEVRVCPWSAEEDAYLILASDGVWDGLAGLERDPEQEGSCLFPLLSACPSAQAASEALTARSLEGMARRCFDDNITNIVLALGPLGASSPPGDVAAPEADPAS